MGPAIKDVGNEEGHFVLNMDFTWTFIRKQIETEKSKIWCPLSLSDFVRRKKRLKLTLWILVAYKVPCRLQVNGILTCKSANFVAV